jgi:hypothetical protein
MTSAELTRRISLIAAPVLAVIGLILGGNWLPALALILIAAGWAYGRTRHAIMDNVGLTLFLAGLAYAIWLDTAGVWLVAGGFAALLAWDVGHFTALTGTTSAENQAVLWQAHWRMLAWVGGVSLALVSVAAIIQIELRFSWAYLLALLAILLLSYLVRK